MDSKTFKRKLRKLIKDGKKENDKLKKEYFDSIKFRPTKDKEV